MSIPTRPSRTVLRPSAAVSEEAVDKTRAWTGFYVVVGGDVAIAVAAAIAVVKFTGGVNATTAVLASILTSAFAAISTMTTAYFGIRATSSTAQRSVKHHSDVAMTRPGASGR